MTIQQHIVFIDGQQSCRGLQRFNLRSGISDRSAIVRNGLQAAVLTSVDLVMAQSDRLDEKRCQNGIATGLCVLRCTARCLKMDQAGLIHQTHTGLAEFGTLYI